MGVVWLGNAPFWGWLFKGGPLHHFLGVQILKAEPPIAAFDLSGLVFGLQVRHETF